MKQSKSLVAILGILALAASAHAQYSMVAHRRGIGLKLWSQELSGELRGVDRGFQGQATLDEDRSFAAGLNANLGKWELGFYSLSNRTTGRVQSVFRFDGQVYTAGDQLQVGHDVEMFDAFRRFTLVSGKPATVHVLGGLKVLDLRTRLQGTINSARSELDKTVVLPMLGLGARIGPRDSVHGFAGVRWLAFESSGVAVRSLDYSLGFAYQPVDRFRVALGYRQFDMDVEVKDANRTGRAIFENTGPFLEAGIQF